MKEFEGVTSEEWICGGYPVLVPLPRLKKSHEGAVCKVNADVYDVSTSLGGMTLGAAKALVLHRHAKQVGLVLEDLEGLSWLPELAPEDLVEVVEPTKSLRPDWFMDNSERNGQ